MADIRSRLSRTKNKSPKFVFLSGSEQTAALTSNLFASSFAEGKSMKPPSSLAPSPIREQAANTLRRARKLPPGPYRNDLRQLGFQLLRLHKLGLRANVQVIDKTN